MKFSSLLIIWFNKRKFLVSFSYFYTIKSIRTFCCFFQSTVILKFRGVKSFLSVGWGVYHLIGFVLAFCSSLTSWTSGKVCHSHGHTVFCFLCPRIASRESEINRSLGAVVGDGDRKKGIIKFNQLIYMQFSNVQNRTGT